MIFVISVGISLRFKPISGPPPPAVFIGSFGDVVSLAVSPERAVVLYILLSNGDIKSVDFATGGIATVVNAGENASNLQFNNG